VVSFTPVGCQPVLLASGKPHARSVLTQFVPFDAPGGGAAGGLALLLPLGFDDAGELGCEAGALAGAEGGGSATELHSEGASDGGAGSGAASFLQATTLAPIIRTAAMVRKRLRRPGNESIIRPPWCEYSPVFPRVWFVEFQQVGFIS
jgi:hypothetical protein